MSEITILEAFAGMPDQRRKQGTRHSLQLCLAFSSRNESHPAIVLVTAYLVEKGLILPPHQVESGSNEITALPPFIKAMALEGVVFAFDAINTQKKL
jgi:hypothetical protein